MDDFVFSGGSVPVSVAAKVYGKDEAWVRAGIIQGWLPIGIATRDGRKITEIQQMESRRRINYYISPRKLYEETGFLWEGDENSAIDPYIRMFQHDKDISNLQCEIDLLKVEISELQKRIDKIEGSQ